MSKGFEFLRTAEGRPRITTFSKWKAWKVNFLLTFRYGFNRSGSHIPAITDEAIYPSFVKDKLQIEAGWDNWFGYDWFSSNESTDEFLSSFYEKHCYKR